MGKCLISLDSSRAQLAAELFFSDFADKLEEAYLEGASFPDISLIVSEINNKILPMFLDKYDVDDLIATIKNGYNANAIKAAFIELHLRKNQLNLKAGLPDYMEDEDFSIIKALVGALETNKIEVQANITEKQEADEAKDDSVVIAPIDTNSPQSVDNYLHERVYATKRNYVIDRFKTSSTVEAMTVSKFIQDVLLKNVFIDTDAKKLVSQLQPKGELSEIDKNLKTYRKNLLKDLVERLNLWTTDGTDKKLEYSDALLNYETFNDVLRQIANQVVSTTYRGNAISLDNPGILFKIAEEYKKSPTAESKIILDNFIDYTILADFNKLFDYYGEGALSVSKYNDDFSDNVRKYNIENALSIDAINASWDEKVQNGIELAAPLYTTIINNTPIINYTTGRVTANNLYPTLVASVFSQYFDKLDRNRTTESLREMMIASLKDPNGLRTEKSIIYTVYKKFYERTGDPVVVPLDSNGEPKNKENIAVSSFYETIKDNTDQTLMHLINKPVSEISRVQYLEAITDAKGNPTLSNSNAKKETSEGWTATRLLENHLNKSYEDLYGVDGEGGFLDKYKLEFFNDKGLVVKYTSPLNDQEYTLREDGTGNYDVATIRALSKDMLGLDFDNKPAYAEFWEELMSLNGVNEEIPNKYLRYLHEALSIIDARLDLYDEEIQSIIKSYTPENKNRTGNYIIDNLLDKGDINARFMTNYKFKLLSQVSKDITDSLLIAQRNFTGNQLKATVSTVEGTQVAGYSNYNYGLGLKQNLQEHRNAIQSVGKNDYNNSPLEGNIFVSDENTLQNFFVRGAAKVGEVTKSNSSQNILETLQFNVNLGYFGRISQSILDGSPIRPIFDITVYSDKSVNSLPAINNSIVAPGKGRINLFVDSKGVAVDEKSTLQLHYDSSGHYYRAMGNNILDTWRKIYGASGNLSKFTAEIDSKTSISEKLKALNALQYTFDKDKKQNGFWHSGTFEHGLKGYPAARYYAKQAGVVLNNWVHFDNSKKNLGPATGLFIKPTLINNISKFEDPIGPSDKFKTDLDEQLVKFTNELRGINFKFDSTASDVIQKLYPDLDAAFFHNLDIHLTKGDSEAKDTTDINPALRKMFYDYNMIQDNLMLAFLGPIYAHKGTNENGMWITQIKRNVAATASIRNYTLGLINGVEDYTTTAFVDDLTSYAKTILGDTHEVVSFDGASFETMTQRIKTWNSLNAKFNGDGGEVHKSFFSHFDPHTGSFAETKHAAFALNYDFIRQSQGANIDFMELHKQLYRADISNVDITKSWKNKVNLKSFNDVFYYKRGIDTKTGLMGSLHKLNYIKFLNKDADGISNYEISTTNVSAGEAPVKSPPMKLNTFFDLWQTLGGIDSVEETDEKTSMFYMKGDTKKYLKPNIKSAEKLLDFETYIGNYGATIVPENYIDGSSYAATEGYRAYKRIFNTKGVVNHHMDLISKWIGKPMIDDQIAIDLKGHDANQNVATFKSVLAENEENLRALMKELPNAKLVKPYQRYKGANIDRISFAGAQKVGQFNLNSLETMHKPMRDKWLADNGHAGDPGIEGLTKLITHPISNFNGGIQLSAWHETENAQVTTPTQMLNALIFNAKSLGKVNQMYAAIGNIVDQELTYVLDGTDENIPQLVKDMSNPKFYEENKDKLLKIFRDIMLDKVNKGNNEEFTLEAIIVELFNHKDFPIDDSQIFSSAIAELTNYFTKTGIRTKFDGMFAVLHPASDILQVHDVQGGYVPTMGKNGEFIPLAIGSRTLQLHEHAEYRKFNDYLKEHDPDPNVREEAGKASTINEQPRNLKGQQVILTLADGSTRALSILKGEKGGDGETHLIPEANALDLVKRQIGTFKDIFDGGSPYNKLGQQAKIKELDKLYNKFLKGLDILKDGDGKKLPGHAHVKYAFDSFANSLVGSANIPSGKNLYEWAYETFSQSKEARDIKMKGLTGDKLVFAKENEYIDKLNTVGKIFLGRLQLFLDHANNGFVDAEGNVSNIPNSLRDKNLFDGADALENAKIEVSRAECIAPITAKHSFLIREGDSIGDITKELMYSRLLEKLDYLNVNADAVLISKSDKKIFLHKGAKPTNVKSDLNHSNIRYYGSEKNSKPWFTNDSGDRLFQIPDGMQVFNINGNLHAYFNGKYALSSNPLIDGLKAGFGNTTIQDSHGGRSEKDAFSFEALGDSAERAALKLIKEGQYFKRAEEMYSSWQVYTDKLIGTRVPGQHFQSFQGMKIIGFAQSNNIHVADEVILLSGADFDIDKQNIIYHSIDKDGTMAMWHPASDLSSKESLLASLKLPMPHNRTVEDFSAELDTLGNPIDNIIPTTDSADISDLPDLPTLLGIYHYIEEGYKLHPTQHANLIAQLVDYDNTLSGNVKTPVISIGAIKNFTVSNINQIIENTSNFLYESNGVTTDTIKQFSNRSPKAAVAKNTAKENPFSQAIQKFVNMTGKQGIGIMASSGLKVHSAVTFAVHKAIQDMSLIYDKLEKIENLIENYKYHITGHINADAFYKGEHSLEELTQAANLLDRRKSDLTEEMTQLIDNIGGGELTFPNINYDLMPESFNNGSPFKSLHRITKNKNFKDIAKEGKLLEFIKLASSFDDDAADTDSQGLSSATDNAKELDLGKLNGLPELLTIWPSATMKNISFEEITDATTSDLVEMFLRNAGKNVFDRSTAKNSINNLISTLNTITTSQNETAVAIALDRLVNNYNLEYKSDIVRDVNTKVDYSVEAIQDFNKKWLMPAQMSTLTAKYLGINQGIPSNNWDLFSFSTGLQDVINTMFSKQKSANKFNFKQFLDSLSSGDTYHKRMIKSTNPLFREMGISFNPLHVLSTNPHFAKQLVAFNSSNTILRESSYRVNAMYHLVEKLRDIGYLGENQTIKKNEFIEAEKFIESTVTTAFIQSEYNSNKDNLNERPVFYDGNYMMNLADEGDRKKFIEWMQGPFLEKLLEDRRMLTNSFIQDLRTDEREDPLLFGKVLFMRLQQDTTNVKNNVQQGHYRDSYIYGIKQVYDNKWTDLQHNDKNKQNNIFNALFWYNLIVNKNNITKNSYAKLLGDMLWQNKKDDNVYKRLFLLKGKMGKSTDVQLNLEADPKTDKFMKLTISGIEFNLLDYFLPQEVGDLNIKERVPEDGEPNQDFDENMGGDDFDASNYDMDSGGGDDGDIASDIVANLGGDEGAGGNDPGDFDPEAPVAEKKRNYLNVLRSKQKVAKNETPLGTSITLILNKEQYGQYTVKSPTTALPLFGDRRSTISDDLNYTPFEDVKVKLNDDQKNAYNYYKLAIGNIHTLLSQLNTSAKVDITYTNEKGQLVTEVFDSNKDYKC